MADAFVYVLLEQLASISYQQIEKEVRLVCEVKKEVAKITSNLKAIQAMLEDAEKRQIKEVIVRDWLENLKDVSYEMDDVLDDWSTEILIQQLDHHQQKGESSTSTAAAAVTKKKLEKDKSTEKVPELLERFETSSFVDLSKTFGREDETEVVMGKLVGESSQEARNLLVLSVVGMGKTTLAHIVYNNEKRKLDKNLKY
ncbi:hypothetical protein ACLB2K_059281 [Fragaria x ananassa]